MTTGKTTKELIDDGWKKVVIPVQHMFPNCQVKYKTKCEDMKSCNKDKDFWDKLDKKVKDWKPVKQPFRTKNVKPKRGVLDRLRKTFGLKERGLKPPKGFEGW